LAKKYNINGDEKLHAALIITADRICHVVEVPSKMAAPRRGGSGADADGGTRCGPRILA
jgi:hypothetical protein